MTLLSSIGQAAAQTFECLEPAQNKVEERVVGGREADARDFPWQVSVQSTLSGFCGGSLVGRTWVLTAAHCVTRETTGSIPYLQPNVSIRIYRPDNANRPMGEERKVVRAYVHEEYSPDDPAKRHDVALLKLDSGYNFDDDRSLVTPATITTDRVFGVPGACAVVTGWGRISERAAPSAILLKASVPLRSLTECSQAYAGLGIDPGHVCAGYVSGGADSCQGDSGGPLVVRGGPTGWIQVGIVSFGRGCGQPGYFGVYTRVGRIRPWIEETVRRDALIVQRRPD
ncbi:serine protease [Methylobacterium soli]